MWKTNDISPLLDFKYSANADEQRPKTTLNNSLQQEKREIQDFLQEPIDLEKSIIRE